MKAARKIAVRKYGEPRRNERPNHGNGNYNSP